MAAMTAEDGQRIMEDYRRRAAPYFIEVPGGRLQVTLTPGGGPPKFAFFPNSQPTASSSGSEPDYDMFVRFDDPLAFGGHRRGCYCTGRVGLGARPAAFSSSMICFRHSMPYSVKA